ncbi:hypothetical protein RclHR1_09210007 [Rhizophagus clarus]|uniref:HTH CENPB-type domain-containing protein n=1 Tax=Rhizophagus clarus TaxID=94130 RepID=A0A2Z6S3G1_9GLOM|nr:hypothetical protein RclHR1_09210007 [Rhizophagus clarus]
MEFLLVSDILKRSDYWLSIDTTLSNANNFRENPSIYPQLEEVMSWIDQQISRNLTLNGPIIQQKAKECADLLDIAAYIYIYIYNIRNLYGIFKLNNFIVISYQVSTVNVDNGYLLVF